MIYYEIVMAKFEVFIIFLLKCLIYENQNF